MSNLLPKTYLKKSIPDHIVMEYFSHLKKPSQNASTAMGTREDFYFDKKLDYDTILAKLREEFLEEWNKNDPSPYGNLDEMERISVLGAGSFGEVKLCRDKNTGKIYAIKYLLKKDLIQQKQVGNIYNEKRVLRSMNFPFLVSLEFSRKDDDFIYLAMPFIGFEIYTYHRKVKKFSEEKARFYASQVFLALEYMHAMSLIYRDLKPENILLDFKGYVKVTDFGFTKRVEERTFTLCGTPEYLAPEIIQSKSYGNSVDWWAFGVLLFEFVAGFSPFSKFVGDQMLMYSRICEADYKMPPYFSSQLKHLITNLLQVDLSQRFGNMINGNRDIKKHEWFHDVDWFAILNRQVKAPYIPGIKDPVVYDSASMVDLKKRVQEDFADF